MTTPWIVFRIRKVFRKNLPFNKRTDKLFSKDKVIVFGVIL